MRPVRSRPVSVEDLLRLKRAERRPDEFWAEFDRGLREKQLTALLRSRPWWRRWSGLELGGRLRRLAWPAAAGAAAAVTLLVFRSVTPRPAADPVASAAFAAALPAPAFVAVAGASHPAFPEPVAAPAETPGDDPLEASRGEAVATTEGGVAPGNAAASWPSASDGADRWAGSPGTVPVASFQISLLPEGGADVRFGRSLLAAASLAESRASAARTVVEPLHQIATPGERRGSRILTAMVSLSSMETAMRSTERAAGRLSEQRLQEQIQRFGARGAGVNVRF